MFWFVVRNLHNIVMKSFYCKKQRLTKCKPGKESIGVTMRNRKFMEY